MNKFISEDILRPLLYSGKNLAEREGFVFEYKISIFLILNYLDYELNINKIQKNIQLLLLHMMLFVVIFLFFRM
jgi:hypothetical protein